MCNTITVTIKVTITKGILLPLCTQNSITHITSITYRPLSSLVFILNAFTTTTCAMSTISITGHYYTFTLNIRIRLISVPLVLITASLLPELQYER